MNFFLFKTPTSCILCFKVKSVQCIVCLLHSIHWKLFSTELYDEAKTTRGSVRDDVSDVTHVLKETEHILVIIEGKNYTWLREMVEKEKRLASELLTDMKNEKNDTDNLHKRIFGLQPKLDDVSKTFNNQIDKSKTSLKDSKEGQKLNELSMTYDPEVNIFLSCF